MDTNFLLRLFERALKTSLVSPLLLAGCDAGLDTRGFASPVCERGSLAVSQLDLAVIPDVLELRSVDVHDPEALPQVLSRFGTACATAADRAACEGAFATLKTVEGFRRACVDYCSSTYLAFTRGDEVGIVSSAEALRAFLGTINTPQEAALLTYLEGYELSCTELERGGVKASGGGFEVIATQGYACGEGTELSSHLLEVTAEGTLRELQREVLEKGESNCATGRRPAGLQPRRDSLGLGAMGRHFAVASHLEAASVVAFVRLRDELRVHGAEASLQRRALRSAREEVQHAKVTAELARLFGARPQRPVVERRPPRSLFEVALENATEGCVRETFGALVAHHQATHATDRRIKKAMTGIAQDETRHAALSWDVDAWAQKKLGKSERARVRAAQVEAIRTLREEAAAPVEPELLSKAGWPSPDASLELVEALDESLWGQT